MLSLRPSAEIALVTAAKRWLDRKVQVFVQDCLCGMAGLEGVQAFITCIAVSLLGFCWVFFFLLLVESSSSAPNAPFPLISSPQATL